MSFAVSGSILNFMEVTIVSTLGPFMPKGGGKTNNHQKQHFLLNPHVKHFIVSPDDRDFLTAG